MIMEPGGLADEVVRLAAAAGCDPHRVTDPETVREQWNCAPLLLLDVDAATASASAGLPRRDGIVI
ncbi:MAG TPA: septum formation initiator, partial [Pseudonocardiaceae bacterium]|nr:septum formation initiator [Pseudonocardiaceae bacterium]